MFSLGCPHSGGFAEENESYRLPDCVMDYIGGMDLTPLENKPRHLWWGIKIYLDGVQPCLIF